MCGKDEVKKVSDIKKHIEEILKIGGISASVVLGWQGLELAILGQINPDKVDSVIALILIGSLYMNLELWGRK
jgi:hypothetical protein